MIKCFLSHSNKDEFYIEIVARKVGIATCIYDKYTFEEGMRPIDEIMKGLDQSDLFVIFLSNNSLKSEWVEIELSRAYSLLTTGTLKRIFPIIIEQDITYKDERIPQWMRDEYNLKFISRPTVAARRIRQRLREISWQTHPRLKERGQIFVGRNILINSFEERMDDFDTIKASCVIASGVPSIGRRSLLNHCIVKSNIVDESYKPSIIYLNRQESIEDFIYKLYDLSLTNEYDLTNFMSKNISEKSQIALSLIDDIHKAKEIVFIIDNGCIINYQRELAKWFIDIIEAIKSYEILTFCIVSSWRALQSPKNRMDHIFFLDVSELSLKERSGLLKRYAEFENLNLSKKDFNFFINLMKGYPEQVIYTIDLIKSDGLQGAKNSSYFITEFNTNRVQRLLSKYEDDDQAINFLYLLSEFDFISYDFIFEIVGENDCYKEWINEFLASAVCELLGANREYIRVIDNVRDYVMRGRLQLDEKYKKRISLHLEDFLKTYKTEDKDVSDFFYSMKTLLGAGKQIDEKYLIPSHYLKTIKHLYDRERSYGSYREVVRLADRILQNNMYLDQRIIHDIRYYLCLSLARLKDERCLKEVHSFRGSDLNFLIGFYYRLKGRYKDAREYRILYQI